MRLQFPEAGLSLPRANSSSSSSPNAHGPRQCTHEAPVAGGWACGPPLSAVDRPRQLPWGLSTPRPCPQCHKHGHCLGAPHGPCRPLPQARHGTDAAGICPKRHLRSHQSPARLRPANPDVTAAAWLAGGGDMPSRHSVGSPETMGSHCVHAEIDAREAEADTGRAQGSASMASPLMPACPTCACTCVPMNEVALCVRARAFCVCLQVRGCFSASRAAVRSCARGQH